MKNRYTREQMSDLREGLRAIMGNRRFSLDFVWEGDIPLPVRLIAPPLTSQGALAASVRRSSEKDAIKILESACLHSIGEDIFPELSAEDYANPEKLLKLWHSRLGHYVEQRGPLPLDDLLRFMHAWALVIVFGFPSDFMDSAWAVTAMAAHRRGLIDYARVSRTDAASLRKEETVLYDLHSQRVVEGLKLAADLGQALGEVPAGSRRTAGDVALDFMFPWERDASSQIEEEDISEEEQMELSAEDAFIQRIRELEEREQELNRKKSQE